MQTRTLSVAPSKGRGGAKGPQEEESAPVADPRSRRIASLDAFRGAVIASMILVNSPGDSHHVFTQLDHVAWNGWTFTDLIAPAFMWIIGVTTTLSLGRRARSDSTRSAILTHIARRSIVLFGVGVAIGVLPALLPPDLSALRDFTLMSILQRIAVGYCLAAAIYLWSGPRSILAWVLGLLGGYWVLLVAVPLPGGGAPSLAPGQNLPQVLDRLLLGHLSAPTHTLLTIPSVTATILIGVLASRLLKVDRSVGYRAVLMAAWGSLLAALGLFLSVWMPINRRLWTPTFSLFTAGVAMVVFAAFYWILDGKGIRRGFRLSMAYGANPIFLFALSAAVGAASNMGLRDPSGTWRSLWTIVYQGVTPHFPDPRIGSALFALAYTLVFGLLAEFMYRRRWIVKI